MGMQALRAEHALSVRAHNDTLEYADIADRSLYMGMQAWMFERAPSEASSIGLRRQRSGRHGAPRIGVPPPARQPQPNVSRSSMLLCKLSASALSKLTAGSSR